EARLVAQKVWKLVTPGATHRLQLVDQKLVEKAGRLKGRQVVATALVRDGVILVLDLSESVAMTAVQLKGKLQYIVRHLHSDEILFTQDVAPDSIHRIWTFSLGLTVDGKTWDLVFPTTEMQHRAELLIGQTVEVCAIELDRKLSITELKPVV